MYPNRFYDPLVTHPYLPDAGIAAMLCVDVAAEFSGQFLDKGKVQRCALAKAQERADRAIGGMVSGGLCDSTTVAIVSFCPSKKTIKVKVRHPKVD